MALTVRVNGYFVEVTPVTVPYAEIDAPPLPPIPERMRMPAIAQKRFPWPFVLSFVVSLLLMAMVAACVAGRG